MLGGLHPVNGLLILFVAHQAARGCRSPRRRAPARRPDAPVDPGFVWKYTPVSRHAGAPCWETRRMTVGCFRKERSRCQNADQPRSGSARRSIEEATRVVESAYAEDLNLNDVARRIATSRRQLQRIYHEIGQTTFRDQLTRVRMDRAAELLTADGLTVRDVANRVGYRQPAQFAKAFRARHGALALGVPPQRRALGGDALDQRGPGRPVDGARRAGRRRAAARCSSATERCRPPSHWVSMWTSMSDATGSGASGSCSVSTSTTRAPAGIAARTRPQDRSERSSSQSCRTSLSR